MGLCTRYMPLMFLPCKIRFTISAGGSHMAIWSWLKIARWELKKKTILIDLLKKLFLLHILFTIFSIVNELRFCKCVLRTVISSVINIKKLLSFRIRTRFMGNFYPWPSLVIIRLFVVTFNTRVHFPLFSNVFFLPKFETKRLKKMRCLSTSYILFALTKSYNMKRRHLNLFTAANLPDINCSVGRNGLELVKKSY